MSLNSLNIGCAVSFGLLSGATYAFGSISPKIFLISTLAGVALGVLQESLFKVIFEIESDVSFKKALRHWTLIVFSSSASLLLYLEMQSRFLENSAMKKKFALLGGLTVGYSVVQFISYLSCKSRPPKTFETIS